ncbi:MAG: DUF1707 and DUF2154 domain-containing protein [Gemmatimonadaceae bacterium]|nr:DUF1707 and DUF2154 domain-containing protein [Gemmatimonadaceae bacterium]
MESRSPHPVDPRSIPARVGEREREQVVTLLGDHFALDHLTVEEYEFRVQAALGATQWYVLSALTTDLPTLDPNRSPVLAADAGRKVGGGTMLAIMGGFSRKGRWFVPERMTIWTLMGGAELDLRDAVLTSPVTEIKVVAIMGGVQIRVPPGVRLETNGIAIMGGFDDSPGVASDNSPVVRVSGLAIMGGVGTEMKPRGWSDGDG